MKTLRLTVSVGVNGDIDLTPERDLIRPRTASVSAPNGLQLFAEQEHAHGAGRTLIFGGTVPPMKGAKGGRAIRIDATQGVTVEQIEALAAALSRLVAEVRARKFLPVA